MQHLAARPDPVITWYDDATGERVELSGRSLDNWVCKTAHLVLDSASAGDRVGVLLPWHWQTAVVLLGLWRAGCVPVLGSAEEDLSVVHEPLVPSVAGEVIGLGLRPMGGRMVDCPAGVTDYAEEIASYGDRFDGSGPVVLVAQGREWSQTDLPPPGPAERLLVVVPDRVVTAASEVAQVLVRPLLDGGSVVLSARTDPALLDRRAEQERVDRVLHL